MDDEILHLNLAARTHLAYELQSLNINPDRTKPLTFQVDSLALNFSKKLSKKLLAINPTLLPDQNLVLIIGQSLEVSQRREAQSYQMILIWMQDCCQEYFIP